MPPLPLATVFADVPDPRRETKNKLHALGDILAIATCAVIAGAETWEDIAEYGRSKEAFLRQYLPLAHGIPSPDTFERVFAKLDPAAFARAFGRWMAAVARATGLTPVAIDGKSARSAPADTATGRLHLVTAWATEARLVLGQVAVADGSNEIAAIPGLLRALDLNGAIVTIDAAGCQTENARLIRDRGGDYLLAVKDNQPTLRAAVEAVFDRACDAGFAGVAHDGAASEGGGHGRHEERYVTVVYDPAGVPDVWPDVAAVAQVNRVRVVGGVRTQTTHYYLSSHRGTAEEFGRVTRSHWGIESLHWVLDVVYGEDDSRVRAGHAGANLGVVRRAAVALTRRAPGKGSGTTKRKKAGWDDEFMVKVLNSLSDA